SCGGGRAGHRGGRIAAMSTVVDGFAAASGAPDPGATMAPQSDYRRLILPVALVAPVLLLVVLTEVLPSSLWGGLLAYSTSAPGDFARGLVIAGSVSSLLGMLMCRWRRWWGFVLATWPFLLIL